MISDEEAATLIKAAAEARKKAHALYSKFPVGSALLTEDGKVIQGCSVENTSLGLTICAERGAICKAVVEGHKKFKVNR